MAVVSGTSGIVEMPLYIFDNGPVQIRFLRVGQWDFPFTVVVIICVHLCAGAVVDTCSITPAPLVQLNPLQ